LAFFANRKFNKSVKKIDNAVSVLSNNGLGYSVTSGVVGNLGDLSAKNKVLVQKAAKTMQYYSAGYYTKTVKKNHEDFKSARYVPLSFANYARVQAKTIKQLYTSSHLRAAVTAITRTLYDTRIQTEIDRYSLGLSVEEAQEWVKRTEKQWNFEKELKSWDYNYQNNYAQVADMAKHMYVGIGEYFAILRIDKKSVRSNILSIQLISPFQVKTPIGGKIPDGHYIDQGIEFDKNNVEAAIWIAPAKIGNDWQRVPIHNKNGFKQVLHGFRQESPGQIRGIPDSSKSWHEFMSIEDMLRFEMDSAKINASVSGSVYASDGNTSESARANLNHLGASRSNGGAGFGGNKNEGIPEDNADVTYDVREVPAGGFIVQNLPPGYNYKEHDTKRPNVNITNFIQKDLDYIYTANFGMADGVVTQVLEGSYNASKAKIDLTWKRSIEYNLKQFEADFDREIYRSWVAAKVGSGSIVVTDWADNRESWLGMKVITPTKPSLNPLVDAKTSDVRLDNGTTNHEIESQNYNGRSFSENVERLGPENEALKRAKQPLEDSE